MSIVLKNRSEVNTRITFPGLLSFDIPAEGSYELEDAVKKFKVPTLEGERELDEVYPAFTLALKAVLDYGKPGLEFEHEGRRYFYGGSEPLVTDSQVVEAVKKFEEEIEIPVEVDENEPPSDPEVDLTESKESKEESISLD